ncbi:MAG: DNA repair protein RecO [Clostridia bacterium]|nr:DNA repair protein RecO [Clostridia bacterium]
MNQTENTAIVLRYANYRENDRMLTLLSPTRGLVEAACRGCRRPKSRLLSASEIFSLGDYELYEKGGRFTVTGFTPIESFFPLRGDYDRLTCGVWLLALCEAAAQPGEPAQALFMLLLHTLSRLTFSDQPRTPLLTGFLLHYAVIGGLRPRLRHCVRCGRELGMEENAGFDIREGGLCCLSHGEPGMPVITGAQRRFLQAVKERPASGWVEDGEHRAPYALMRRYVEAHLEGKLRATAPEEEEHG